MPDTSYELHGVLVFECAAEGPPIRNDRDALGPIQAASEHDAPWVVIPVERLPDDFFRLKTRIAGEILQKFVTYSARVAILGDISRYVAESTALRDFVYESNRGDQIWFVADRAELEERLRRWRAT